MPSKSLREQNPQEGDPILFVEKNTFHKGLLLAVFSEWRTERHLDAIMRKGVAIEPDYTHENGFHSKDIRIIYPLTEEDKLPLIRTYVDVCGGKSGESFFKTQGKYNCEGGSEFYVGNLEISKALKNQKGFESYAKLFE